MNSARESVLAAILQASGEYFEQKVVLEQSESY